MMFCIYFAMPTSIYYLLYMIICIDMPRLPSFITCDALCNLPRPPPFYIHDSTFDLLRPPLLNIPDVSCLIGHAHRRLISCVLCSNWHDSVVLHLLSIYYSWYSAFDMPCLPPFIMHDVLCSICHAHPLLINIHNFVFDLSCPPLLNIHDIQCWSEHAHWIYMHTANKNYVLHLLCHAQVHYSW